MKTKTDSLMHINHHAQKSAFIRTVRYRSVRSGSGSGGDHHLHQLNSRSLSQFRTSVRYSKKQQEYDLQQKIDLEIKMREGTAKLLAACKYMNQSLEAAKSLLTSDTRLEVFRNELQQRKSAPKIKLKKSIVHQASASVSEIRIPLIWKDTEYFKNKGDYRRFAVFCLLQIGSEIYDTVMINVDRNATNICFEDTFIFHRIQPNFQFKLFVYARVLQDDLSMVSTHRKFTQRLSNSVSRSLGRKFTDLNVSFDPERGPKFTLMATATLNLKDASDSVKTHDLTLEHVDKSIELPLFGDFCCRFAVQPECQLKEFHSGLVKFREITADSTAALHWCSLKGFKLLLWPVAEELRNEPVFVKHTIANSEVSNIIPITNQCKVIPKQEGINIVIGEKSYSIQACSGNTGDWHKALLQCIDQFLAWEPIAEYQMDLASVHETRSQYLPRTRHPGSLYDETPIQELRKRHSKSLSNVASLDTKYNTFSKSIRQTSKLIN